jgi:hypothetical protein
MSYWYYEGPDDRHFCWAKAPTFVCENAEGLREEDAERIAVELGITKIDEIIANAHRRAAVSLRERVDGKLTDSCRVCGAKLTRKGFAAWEERPADPTSSKARIGARLGLHSHERVGTTRYFRTKAKAKAWALKHSEKGVGRA